MQRLVVWLCVWVIPWKITSFAFCFDVLFQTGSLVRAGKSIPHTNKHSLLACCSKKKKYSWCGLLWFFLWWQKQDEVLKIRFAYVFIRTACFFVNQREDNSPPLHSCLTYSQVNLFSKELLLPISSLLQKILLRLLQQALWHAHKPMLM